MSTRERVLWLSVCIECALGVLAALMQNWWASATMAIFAMAALFTIWATRKPTSVGERVRVLGLANWLVSRRVVRMKYGQPSSAP